MKLKEMRQEAGLTQAELAKLCDINLRSLQDYEQGHKQLTGAKAETLWKLGRVLGYSVEDILQDYVITIENEDRDPKQLAQRIMAYERSIQRKKDRTVHFPVVVADDFVDMSRIYPTKQGEVKRVLNQLRNYREVKELYLFGSAITMACHKDSDLDLAVGLSRTDAIIQNKVSELIQEACNWTADIVWLDHLTTEERIYKEIKRGLVLI